MSISILFALGAMVVGALADLIYKWVQSRGINPATFVFYQALTFCIALWIPAILFGQISAIKEPTWVYGLPMGPLGYLGIVLFVLSLKDGKASVYVPVFRLSFIITAVLAFFLLSEPITFVKIVGILLAAGAVLSLADFSGFTTGRVHFRSMVYLLAATVAFGLLGVLSKEAISNGAGTTPLVMVQSITFTSAALIFMLASREVRPNGITARFAPVMGILQLAWILLLYQSLERGEASISYPIVQLSFVATAILAVLFLHEVANRALVIGLSMASLSVIAFAMA